MWQEIQPGEVQQPGGTWRMDHETGRNYRWEDDPPASPLDRIITVTKFTNYAAKTKAEVQTSLRDLVPLLQDTTADAKADLPWLKLATFGDKRTDANSLRHDENMLTISGIEADYDAEKVPPEDAATLLTALEIAAIIYTSPSHTDDTPRWRVLCPISQSLAPGNRFELVARLNGCLGGILANESFTRSQSYYYGSVASNPSHKVFVVEGRYIDQATEMQPIYKQGRPAAEGSKEKGSDRPAPMPDVTGVDTAWLINNILNGVEYHDSTRDLAAQWAADGMPLKRIIASLRGILEAAEPDEKKRDQRWKDRYNDVPRAAASGVHKYGPKADQADPDAVFGGPAWQWRDPSTIPPRQWIYGKHYIRGFLGATIAPGGLGKSSAAIVEALDMVTDKGLLTGVRGRRYRVMYWCGEDPLDEIERRVAAACKHYGITPEDIGDRLILVSGRDHKLLVATGTRDGVQVNQVAVERLVKRMKADAIDVLICDPFVCTHAVPENDNVAINLVVDVFRDIADVTNAAVELVHHTRKVLGGQSGGDRSVDDGRGAKALVDGARSVRVLNTMSDSDAESLGIPEEERRLFFRVDNGKANMAPPAKVAVWRHLASVDLGNGLTDWDGQGDWPSDHVGVVERWERPAVDEGITPAHVGELQRRLRDGAPNRRHILSTRWAGNTLAEVLAMDPNDPRDRKRLQAILESFVAAKVLRVESEKDTKKGREVEFLMPGVVTSPVASHQLG